MKVHYPTAMYKRGETFSPSDMWMDAAGWSGKRVYPLIIPASQTSEEVPDVFIQKGSGRRNHNDLYHCKLPEDYTYVSQASLQFWCSSNGFWPGYQVYTGDLISRMHKWSDNGIHSAYFFKRLSAPRGEVIIMCTPARGIGSSFWRIGDISYKYVREMANPNWRYNCETAEYWITDNTKYPWVSDNSYDSALVEMVALANLHMSYFNDWDKSGYSLASYTEYSVPSFTENLFGEDKLISGYAASQHAYELNWLTQHAFYDACSGIGKANDNTIQNIVQIIADIAGVCETFGMGGVELAEDVSKVPWKTLSQRKKQLKRQLAKKGLVSYDAIKVAEGASDTWLGYRYAYSTSLMDYREYSKYLNYKTQHWLDFVDKNYHEVVYGTSELSIDGSKVRCICELSYRPRAYQGLKTCLQYIHDLGLELNPYVLWDFVPYSFVVDWALPVGDVLDVISNQKYYTSEYYDFGFCGFSVKYEREVGSRYYRWYSSPPQLENEYWFDRGGKRSSSKMKLKRTLDAVSLIIGK